MKVGIDISPVIYGRGVSRYTSNLVLSLAQISDIQLSLYGSSLRQYTQLESFGDQVQKISRKPVKTFFDRLPPTVLEILWSTLQVNTLNSSFANLDVFHGWDWLMPPDKRVPLVSTVHDLAILKFPDTAHAKILDRHQQAWKVLKQRQAEIIAVSHSTKRDLIELLDFSPSKIHVIHEALPQETVAVSDNMTEEQSDKIADDLHLNQPYIFFVGTQEPRKNLSRLIEAWKPLAKDIQLLIAGASGWDDSQSQAMKLPVAVQNQLRFLGRVSEKQLAVLYERAELLAYPCLYEGFGLPILEAFYHGIPVVTSNVSGMQEIAGNAAELVDPQSVESIRAGIKKVLNEGREAQQRRLQQMVIRLQLFDWRRVAIETAKVYALAAQQRS